MPRDTSIVMNIRMGLSIVAYSSNFSSNVDPAILQGTTFVPCDMSLYSSIDHVSHNMVFGNEAPDKLTVNFVD